MPTRIDLDAKLAQLCETWEARGVTLSAYASSIRPTIELYLIEVPKPQRRNGTGTRVLGELCAIADAHGRTITLTVSTDRGASRAGLERFYRGAGFVRNRGRHIDLTLTCTHYRPPAV